MWLTGVGKLLSFWMCNWGVIFFQLSVPHGGSLFGDDEDDDLFSSTKTQPVVPAFYSQAWGG